MSVLGLCAQLGVGVGSVFKQRFFHLSSRELEGACECACSWVRQGWGMGGSPCSSWRMR